MPAIPEQFRNAVTALPPALRALLDAELDVGNRIRRVDLGDPAPADGWCVMLNGPVTTRPRESGDGLTFWLESSSEYKASFTDQDAKHFILERPLEVDGAYPDMNEIREAANRSYSPPVTAPYTSTPMSVPERGNQTRVEKFRSSMNLDYDKWREGIGYDLEVIADATEKEKAEILAMVVPPKGWREVEALVALDTDAARAELKTALKSGNEEVRAAVLKRAPSTATGDERLTTLVKGLEEGVFYGGLSSVLGQIEDYHPPEVINALFRGLFQREGGVATHFAAMLAYLHDKADSSFDWDHRPLFLKFNTEDRAARQAAFAELCELIELDPAEVMTRINS